MATAHIPIIDLYHFVQTLDEDVYADHVHFTPAVTQLQRAYVAGFVRGILAQSDMCHSSERVHNAQ